MAEILTLSKGQYLFYAATFRTISEGIILGASAAFFLPETLQIKEPISIGRYLIIFSVGLISLLIGGILEKKGEK